MEISYSAETLVRQFAVNTKLKHLQTLIPSFSPGIQVNENVNKSISIKEDTGPTEFQAEVLEMTIDRFIDETNIREIACNELRRQNEVVTDERVDALIDAFFNRRLEIERWWFCGLKHLKYRLCECKRGPQIETRNVRIQKDVRTREKFTQCDHHDDTMPSISTQTVDFTEVRMSQLTERHETQGTQRNRLSDPLEASLVNVAPEINSSPGAVPMNEPQPEPVEQTAAYFDSLPMYAPLIIEVDDSDSETDTGDFEVLLETTTQTQNFDDVSLANTEQLAIEPENPSSVRDLFAPESDDVIVKDEPMSISQINKKYEGDVVAEEILEQIVVLNETPNTQQMFNEIMEKEGSGSIDDSSTVDIEPSTFAAASVNVNHSSDPVQNCKCSQFAIRCDSNLLIFFIFFSPAPVQSTQGIATNAPLITHKYGKQDDVMPKRPEKPCPKSKKKFYAENGSVQLQPNRPELTAVPIQDVEGAMAELFAGTESPEMNLQQTENNGQYCCCRNILQFD